MYTAKSHQISNRIVSISQPHVRPIVRGKAKAAVEFGAKVAVSVGIHSTKVATFSRPWKRTKKRYGYYPEAVLADQIYRTRDNRAYCKTHGIRLSGPSLGPPAAGEVKHRERLERQDMRERNAVEGGFGVGKRRNGLGRIMVKLKKTAESVIMLVCCYEPGTPVNFGV